MASGADSGTDYNSIADRIYIEGWALALTFAAVEQYLAGSLPAAAGCAVMSAVCQFVVIRWAAWIKSHPDNRFLRTLNGVGTNAIWWVITLSIFLGYLALSPYVQEHRWPFAAQVPKIEGPDTGPIIWTLEPSAKGNGYFLNMQKILNQPNQEIRVLGFQAHGKNVANSPISNFRGYLRSDLTNVQIPIFIYAEDPDAAKAALVCVGQPWVPTVPEETFGIPPFADFDITTFEKPFDIAGIDGFPLKKFMNDFVPFTIVLEYDGKKYERQFTKDEVDRQVTIFEESLTPQTSPRVMRKANAKRAPLTPLTTLIPPDPPKSLPGLASPIPPAGLPKLETK
jgi:hypothetical protein